MVDKVGQDFRGSGDGDTALVTELVKSAFHTEITKPVLAVCCSPSHSSEHFVTGGVSAGDSFLIQITGSRERSDDNT